MRFLLKTASGPLADIPAFCTRLLTWFDQHKRDMPWRRTRDPYRIWVSEVMLQQTRVDTVKPYYERWIDQFPTVDALADAPIELVLKAWEGLGYYSRARNLHAASRIIRERHASELPDTYAGLRSLPGIGDYTAGAVASVAFALPEPVVDGNVRRVLHRLFDAPRLSTREQRERAALLISPRRPGDFNQGMMELGSTICTPRAPRCDDCPVHRHCLAYARGTQLLRPAAKPKKPVPERQLVTVVLRDPAGRVLLRQRPATGLLAGLWEFPELENIPAIDPSTLTHMGDVKHVFSHFKASYRVITGTVDAGTIIEPALEWATLEQLDLYTLPTAQRRIAQLCALDDRDPRSPIPDPR